MDLNDVQKQQAELLSDGTTADAQPVCPNCLRECKPLEYYCSHCGNGDVINPLTPYISFLNIRYNLSGFGKMWNKLWFDSKTKPWFKIFSLILWIQHHFLIACIAQAHMIWKGRYKQLSGKTAKLLFFVIPFLVILLILLFVLGVLVNEMPGM